MISIIFLLIISQSTAEKYPNEIMETPVVLCEPERIVIKIKTSSSNPSHMYAEDFAEDPDCSSRNMNKIALRHGKCGMSSEKTDSPAGVIQRICIAAQLHPLFVTESDRSYCAQCVYVESHVLDDFEQTLDISEAPPTDLAPQFDFNDVPKCTYSIRKESETGPEIHFSTIGERVFHVWNCESKNTGILVQNCHVEDGQGNRILIIDQNGCGVDHYVMATPKYNDELTMAFQETRVFKFAQKTVTRFICQIRICLKGEDCKKLSPPSSCPTLDERLQQAKRLRDSPAVGVKKIFDMNSSSDEETDEDITAPPRTSKSEHAKILKSSKIKADGKEKNVTMGSIWEGYGFDSQRQRRDLILSTQPRMNTKRGYPEVDLVGELRVLESQEDVQYYEQHASEVLADCVSSITYSLLITALVIVSLLLITLILLIAAKSANYKNKILRFAH